MNAGRCSAGAKLIYAEASVHSLKGNDMDSSPGWHLIFSVS